MVQVIFSDITGFFFLKTIFCSFFLNFYISRSHSFFSCQVVLSSGFLLCRILKRRIKTKRVIEMPSDVNEHSLKVR